MTGISKKHVRFLALILLVAIVVTLIPLAFNGYNSKAAGLEDFSGDDGKIAADISNATGVSIEKVLQLKKQGKSWNEVLERLKLESGNSGDKQQRDDRLLIDTLGSDEVEALIKEGYKQEDIMEAKLLTERVMFQLQQIINENEDLQKSPSVETVNPGGPDEKETEDISAFANLSEKIDESSAVKLMLKLKADFGSFEGVLDEYLFTLQADMNLEDYLSDKDAYLKQKEEKSLELVTQEIITMAVIEEKLLKKIQAKHEEAQPGSAGITENIIKPEKNTEKTDMPQPPVPVVEEVKPKNPADDIMNEIKQISPVQNIR